MKKKNLLMSILNNYRQKNFETDFIKAGNYNYSIFLDNLSEKSCVQLSKLVNKIVNDNYFDGRILVFSNSDDLLKLFLTNLSHFKHYTNFETYINTTRKSKITFLSKLKELNVQNNLLIIPSFDKEIYELYIELLALTNQNILCTKQSFIKNIKYSYINNQIIKTLVQKK